MDPSKAGVINSSDSTVMALYNWWGDKTGPKAVDNPKGAGALIEGNVIYRPYLPGINGSAAFLPSLIR